MTNSNYRSRPYEELTKIIKAYGRFSVPVGLDNVSKFIGIHTTIISGNAGFLIAVGVLDPGARKVLTPNEGVWHTHSNTICPMRSELGGVRLSLAMTF